MQHMKRTEREHGNPVLVVVSNGNVTITQVRYRFLLKAEALHGTMQSRIKEVGLAIYATGHYLSDMMMGEIHMAMSVAHDLGLEDRELSELMIKAFNVDFRKMQQRNPFPSEFDHQKKFEKGA